MTRRHARARALLMRAPPPQAQQHMLRAPLCALARRFDCAPPRRRKVYNVCCFAYRQRHATQTFHHVRQHRFMQKARARARAATRRGMPIRAHARARAQPRMPQDARRLRAIYAHHFRASLRLSSTFSICAPARAPRQRARRHASARYGQPYAIAICTTMLFDLRLFATVTPFC